MQNWKLRLLGYSAGAWQFRWQGLAAAFLFCLAGWLGVALIPNTFQSEAKVYINTDTLLRPLLKGLTVTTDTDQEIAVMLRSLLANPNLERVIRATDPTAGTMSGARMQDAIDDLREKVSLKNLGAANLYSIAYRGPDPKYAQSVSQSLLSVLIDSNLGNQRRDSDNVQSFLDNQIADYEQKLTQADKLRAEFKSAHINFFAAGSNGGPVEIGGGIVAATAAVTQAQTALSEAVARRDSLRAQLKTTQATLDVNAPAPMMSDGSQGSMGAAGQLAMARNKLNDLKTRYTDDYPDVANLKRLIERLQSDIKNNVGGSDGNMQGISNPTYVAIRTKLADEEAEVAVDQNRLNDAQTRVGEAKQTALEAISVQRQYEDLNRDYQVLHQNYEQLVARRESANISEAAGGQQSAVFQVIDPPLRPDRPIAPNRLLFNALVLLAGIAAGAGTALAFSEFYGRFFNIEKLSEAFSVPVLGAITAIQTTADIMRQRRTNAIFAAGIGCLMLSYLVVLFLFHSRLATPQGTIL